LKRLQVCRRSSQSEDDGGAHGLTLNVQHQSSSIRTHAPPRIDCQRETHLVSATKELDPHYSVFADRSWKHKKARKDEMGKDEAK
jgi:hypothetical protein